MLILLLTPVLIFSTSEEVQKNEFPVFRVVIDPGHGGVTLTGRQKHGDRYDMLSGEYLSYFAEGAKRGKIYEHIIVYSIAEKISAILSHCAPDGDFEKFREILKKYTNGKVKRVYIESVMSRGESISGKKASGMKDPNSEFRLYDYPGEEGKISPGRISKINALKPHLVVSLHLAGSAPPEYLGMNPILAPPYDVLKTGLIKLQHGGSKKIEDHGLLKSWFRSSGRISPRLSYYKDVVGYFTGFDLNRDYTVNTDEFRGYKYNMVTWKYADKEGWHEKAKFHKPETKYSNEIKVFKEEGVYWERESAVYEKYRRGENFENFGGDNSLASYEIIKYILLSLDKKGVSRKDKIPGKAFVSTWSIPMLVNAVSAYIELGYLNRPWDREVLLYRHDEIAEGVAVGIYSLFAGLDNLKGNLRHKPSGENIDFEKYRLDTGKTYFDIVADE
jgi:hypothetical protein